MSIQLMRAAEILPVHRIINAVLQSELNCQLHPRHGLEAIENKVLVNATLGNAFIAMLSVTIGKDGVRGNRLPEGNVIKRLKPRNHIINVFKDHHDTSVPEAGVVCQFLEACS